MNLNLNSVRRGHSKEDIITKSHPGNTNGRSNNQITQLPTSSEPVPAFNILPNTPGTQPRTSGHRIRWSRIRHRQALIRRLFGPWASWFLGAYGRHTITFKAERPRLCITTLYHRFSNKAWKIEINCIRNYSVNLKTFTLNHITL